MYSYFVVDGIIVLPHSLPSLSQLYFMSMYCGLQLGLYFPCFLSCLVFLEVRFNNYYDHHSNLVSLIAGVLYFVQPSTSTHLWNYFLHVGLQLGVSMMVFVYATEFYARKTCVQEETLISTFVPRFYNCFFYT